MPQTLRGIDLDRLERSCSPQRNSIRFGASAPGLERAEVYLTTCAFDRHRHDTYAIGITTAGVQRFWYRGTHRSALPGQLHVLHPDEIHDGGAATADGFGYRILYIAPELIRAALDDDALPFVADPVPRPTPATHIVASFLADIDEQISDLAQVEIVAALADTLRSLAGRRRSSATAVDLKAVQLARDYLAAHAREQTPASTLEQITGTDRFTLARHFRHAFGTSPDRYRAMRRLGLARTAIENGLSIARAAADAGFADQSHMTRQFKRTFGLTPGRWVALTAARSEGPPRTRDPLVAAALGHSSLGDANEVDRGPNSACTRDPVRGDRSDRSRNAGTSGAVGLKASVPRPDGAEASGR
jgi:AraC-like DNA-binding protein